MSENRSVVRTLSGVRILIGRPAGQGDTLTAAVEARGGRVVHVPLIRIEPGDEHQLDRAVAALVDGAYAALALTSPNGVDALVAACWRAGVDPARLDWPPIVACVGSGTAQALTERTGVRPGLVPTVATTTALAEAFPAGHGRVLLPRADLANPVLSEVLATKGYQPDDVVAYRTRHAERLPAELRDALAAGRIDLVALTSSSIARAFAALAGDLASAVPVVSIGPVTSATCRELGVQVYLEARDHDLGGVIDALERATTLLADHHPGPSGAP